MQIKFTYIEFFDEMSPLFSKVFYKTLKDNLSGPLNRRVHWVLGWNATTDKSITKKNKKNTGCFCNLET